VTQRGRFQVKKEENDHKKHAKYPKPEANANPSQRKTKGRSLGGSKTENTKKKKKVVSQSERIKRKSENFCLECNDVQNRWDDGGVEKKKLAYNPKRGSLSHNKARTGTHFLRIPGEEKKKLQSAPYRIQKCHRLGKGKTKQGKRRWWVSISAPKLDTPAATANLREWRKGGKRRVFKEAGGAVVGL